MVEMEPTNEVLEEEIHFSEQESTGFEQETKAVISFADAWKWELDYRERIKMRSLQASVASGLPPASSQELSPKTNVDGRERKAAFPSSPLKKEASPSPSQPAVREFHNSHMPPQQLQRQQAHRISPQYLQYRRPLLQHPSFQKPSLPFPNERQISAGDFSYQQHSPKQTLDQHPQPRQLPDLQTPPRPLDNHLQSSFIQRPLLQLPKNQTLDRQPQPSHTHNCQIVPWNDHLQSLSSQVNPCWCNLCEVPCMNDFNYEQHCQGKKHKAKWEEAFGNSKEIEMKKHKVLWCNVCSVHCVNELALAQHRVGKKHALRLFELQVLNAGGPEVPNFSEPKCEQV